MMNLREGQDLCKLHRKGFVFFFSSTPSWCYLDEKLSDWLGALWTLLIFDLRNVPVKCPQSWVCWHVAFGFLNIPHLPITWHRQQRGLHPERTKVALLTSWQAEQYVTGFLWEGLYLSCSNKRPPVGLGNFTLISTITYPEVLSFNEAFSFSPPDVVTSVFWDGKREKPNTYERI